MHLRYIIHWSTGDTDLSSPHFCPSSDPAEIELDPAQSEDEQSVSSTSPPCMHHSQRLLTPRSPLVTRYDTHHCARVAYSTPDGATQRMKERLYTGHLSDSRSILTHPGDETQLLDSPASSGAAAEPPPPSSFPPVQRTQGLHVSTSFSDAAMRRRHTHPIVRHLDIEIQAAEANLAQLRKQQPRLVNLLMYDNNET